MGQHHKEGNDRTDGRCQSGTVNAHVAGEHEKVITENIEDAPGQYAEGSQARIIVVPQEGCQHLIEQVQGEDPQDGGHVGFGHGQQRFIRTEEGEYRFFKAEDAHPAQSGQQHRANDGDGKILHFTAVMDSVAASLGTENHTAADAHQQPQAVDDVPHRGYHCQCCRAVGTVILPHHGHIHNGVDAGNQCTAKGSTQVLEVKGLDFAIQQIHVRFLLLQKKSRIRNRHFSLRLIRLMFPLNRLPSDEQVTL